MKPISDERAMELRNWCAEVDALFEPHANTSPCAEVFVPTSDLRALLATREEAKGLREALGECELLSASGNTIHLDFGSRKDMEAAYDLLEALTGDKPNG